jgi:hypothetical protein
VSGADRRTASRVPHHGRLLHREFMLAPEKPSFNDDQLADLSATGVAFVTAHRYEIDAMVECKLMLVGWDKFKAGFYMGDPRKAAAPFVAIVKVASCRHLPGGQHRVAASFESVDESHREALARYLAERETGNA